MRRGGGKAKGSQFERDVCTLLSRWVSSGKQDDCYWRAAMSGGRATVAHKKGKLLSNQVGDISCIHPIGSKFTNHFALECKFYADLDLQGLHTGKGKLLEFWEEITKQATQHKKLPFMIAKQNRLKPFVYMSEDGAHKLGLGRSRFAFMSVRYNMWALELDKFLKVCTPYVDVVWRSAPNRQRKRLISV